MTNLLELAAQVGNDEYLEWARERLAGDIDVAAFVYQPIDIFEGILGVNQRIYQKWEQRPDFPVRDPARLSTKKTAPRIYSQDQVHQIMLWYWLTHFERPGYLTVFDVASQLYLSVTDVIQLARSGRIPMEGLFIAEDVFAEWLVGSLFRKE